MDFEMGSSLTLFAELLYYTHQAEEPNNNSTCAAAVTINITEEMIVKMAKYPPYERKIIAIIIIITVQGLR